MVQDTRALAPTFEVSGLPPVETEAQSVFAAGHPQAKRVRACSGRPAGRPNARAGHRWAGRSSRVAAVPAVV
ncbi:hypothetical protein GCM10010429_01250 [Micromonospora olivasterospora]|uniref:Uncharacterized protein n=1 Tax=Micromonospora olivasterospora TaxID=1880 RepID=A0A562I3R4_MICOL|nr:hypothetical protein JD77_00373 [Micromonospora olivasterospora]